MGHNDPQNLIELGNVQGRGISLHGEAVATVLAYRVKGDLHDADVLVNLTLSGQIADIDLSAE